MINLEKFKKDVAEGKIKDKWYFYKRTEKQKQTQAEEIPKLILYFKQRFGLNLYPMYGTLLGIVRDHDFIAHDNDVDLAYLSLQNNKESVLKEFYRICQTLKTEGFLAKICSKGQLHCFGESKTFKYDVWVSWIESDNLFHIVPVQIGIDKSIIIPFKKYEFRKTQIIIPNNPSKLLDILYNNWQEPISENWRKPKCKRVL